MQRIAFLGGTFDPIHIAHLRTAVELLNAGFDQVQIIPNATPPHRAQPQASSDQRLAMLELACQGVPELVVNNIELNRSEISYTADTVSELRRQYTDASLTWVMGQDAWQGFDRWYLPEQVLANVNLLIVDRLDRDNKILPDYQQALLAERSAELADLLETGAGKVTEVQWPLLEISATQIRSALANQQKVDYLLPKAVIDYINQHQLYSLAV